MKQPWVRLHTDLPANAKVQRLTDKLFRFLINSWCLLDENGALPPIDQVAWELRMTEECAVKMLVDLIAAGLYERDGNSTVAHNWGRRQFKSDVSTERVKQFRERKRNVSRNGDETLHETDQIQKQIQNTETEQKPPLPPTKTTPIFLPTIHLDELYTNLQTAYSQWAPHFVKSDFTGPAWHEWKILDYEQKLKAINGIMNRRERGDDPAFAPNPTKYLRGRESEWSRPPRPEPQPRLSDKQRLINSI